jgi:hypothetical protein
MARYSIHENGAAHNQSRQYAPAVLDAATPRHCLRRYVANQAGDHDQTLITNVVYLWHVRVGGWNTKIYRGNRKYEFAIPQGTFRLVLQRP